MKSIIVIMLALFCLNSLAARVATVTTSKAVVFADKELTSPLGYIRFGKKVRVSDNPIGVKDIYAVIVSGRVAYIQTKDLSLSDEVVSEVSGHQKINEHNVDELFKDDIDKLSENNFLTLTYGQMALGPQWEELTTAYNDTLASATVMSLALEHRPPNKPMAFAIGLNYLSAEQEKLAVKTVGLDVYLFYSLLFNSTFSIDLVGQLSGSGDIQFTDPNAEDFNRGLYLGGGVGGQIRLFPASQWGFVGGLKMMKFKVFDTEPFNTGSEEMVLNSLDGVHMYLGVSYKL
ncbi:hypothetical protein [Bacteriovorax sp. BSW11_IV]|uniref:hypothetical protein n=1 Tax=Bacteriovorax sp. BSW11_IV TaxID=1353529 RepID=UPI00055026CD|nr:hypothetical protein [Bacteriovorax sp. BSW11_IV]